MIHEKYIKRCFELALQGKGKVFPNPMVGAVIVKNGKVISEGYHKTFGGDHAEINAIKNAKEKLEGAVLYCNLEPCNHTNKQTPPCVPKIISSGIRIVVISNIDPNPEVSGKGVAQLKKAGITVIENVLNNDGKELNKEYFTKMQRG